MTLQQWNTKSQGVDYRIGPRETKIETCTFQLPDTIPPGPLTVTAVLNYQKLVKPVADLTISTFYFFFTEKGEVAGLEDAFIMFNNLFNKELDIYVGQFQVSGPLFKRELRLTYEDYKIYSTKVGQARADLTYDRGLMFTYSFSRGPDLCLEIVNGLGLYPADDLDTFDTDKYKNFLLRVSQDLSEAVRIGAFGTLVGKDRVTLTINSGG